MRRSDSTEKSIDPISQKAQYRAWLDMQGESNDERIERLKKNVWLAVELELTETQRAYAMDFYLYGLSVTDIAKKYFVAKSTVSRTLARARKRIRRPLKYLL